MDAKDLHCIFPITVVFIEMVESWLKLFPAKMHSIHRSLGGLYKCEGHCRMRRYVCVSGVECSASVSRRFCGTVFVPLVELSESLRFW